MDEKTEFWNVFTKTGRVEDYLRYCGYDTAKEAKTGETQDGRSGDSGDPRGGIG